MTAGADKTARIWDAATGSSLAPALAHDDVVESAAFATAVQHATHRPALAEAILRAAR